MSCTIPARPEGAGPWTVERYFELIRKTPDQVEAFLARVDGYDPNEGWTYDAELGWVQRDATRPASGIDGSATFYHFDADGARRVINGRDQPGRIFTFGDSFTQCDQVNDGETWQEYLAAQMCEPIRNFGVGGYSVYQAYRRMRKLDREGLLDGDHIILNIFEDDHFRNLEQWRAIRHARRSTCGYTLPHLRVDLDADTVTEHENPLPAADEVYNLCDLDFLVETFGDDAMFNWTMAMLDESGPNPFHLIPVPMTVGTDHIAQGGPDAHRIRRIMTESGLRATRYVIELFETFCRATNRRFMIVLSFGPYTLLEGMRDRERYDGAFAAWLKQRGYPVVDLCDAYRDAWRAAGSPPINDFLKPFFCGHHSPAGNFFTMWSMKEAVVDWLNPKPLPYRT